MTKSDTRQTHVNEFGTFRSEDAAHDCASVTIIQRMHYLERKFLEFSV